MHIIKPGLLPIFVCVSCSLFAQKGVNSVYSAYGIGDYKMRAPNSWLGMGNVGVAIQSQNAINEINPASFGWIGKDKFLLDFTLSGLSTKYLNEKTNTQAGDFSISRIAMGLQVVNPVKTVFGLRRFSQVEYYTTATREVAGVPGKLSSEVEGNGGLVPIIHGQCNCIK